MFTELFAIHFAGLWWSTLELKTWGRPSIWWHLARTNLGENDIILLPTELIEKTSFSFISSIHLPVLQNEIHRRRTVIENHIYEWGQLFLSERCLNGHKWVTFTNTQQYPTTMIIFHVFVWSRTLSYRVIETMIIYLMGEVNAFLCTTADDDFAGIDR